MKLQKHMLQAIEKVEVGWEEHERVVFWQEAGDSGVCQRLAHEMRDRHRRYEMTEQRMVIDYDDDIGTFARLATFWVADPDRELSGGRYEIRVTLLAEIETWNVPEPPPTEDLTNST